MAESKGSNIPAIVNGILEDNRKVLVDRLGARGCLVPIDGAMYLMTANGTWKISCTREPEVLSEQTP